jgi:hypothetical protein
MVGVGPAPGHCERRSRGVRDPTGTRPDPRPAVSLGTGAEDHQEPAPSRAPSVDRETEAARPDDLGATHADHRQDDETWVVLARPEGNELCVLTPGRPPSGVRGWLATRSSASFADLWSAHAEADDRLAEGANPSFCPARRSEQGVSKTIGSAVGGGGSPFGGDDRCSAIAPVDAGEVRSVFGPDHAVTRSCGGPVARSPLGVGRRGRLEWSGWISCER